MGKAFLLPAERIVGAGVLQSTTAVGDPMNVGNDHAGVIWRSGLARDATPAIVLGLDLGKDIAVDTIMVFGITGSGPDALVRVRARSAAAGDFEGPGYDGPLQPLFAGSEMPASGRQVAIIDVGATLASGSLNRRIRLEFAFGDAARFIQIGRVAIGKRLTLDRNFAFGAGFGLRDLGAVDFSSGGGLLRRRAPKLRTVGLTFANAYRDEVEAKVQPLIERAGGQEAIALCVDPEPHPMRSRRCYFGPITGDLGTVQRSAQAWEWRAALIDLFPVLQG